MTTEQELVKKIEEKLRTIDTLLTSTFLLLEQLKKPLLSVPPCAVNAKLFDPADYDKLDSKPGIDKRYD